MIEVIPKPDQAAVVKEFFELFKAPWKFYSAGRDYDVVLATAEQIPDVRPRLVLIYGADSKSNDEAIGIGARRRSCSVQNLNRQMGTRSLGLRHNQATFLYLSLIYLVGQDPHPIGFSARE